MSFSKQMDQYNYGDVFSCYGCFQMRKQEKYQGYAASATCDFLPIIVIIYCYNKQQSYNIFR